jgi:hypothetical protein
VTAETIEAGQCRYALVLGWRVVVRVMGRSPSQAAHWICTLDASELQFSLSEPKIGRCVQAAIAPRVS